MKKLLQKKGFTLIEMLIVVAIMVILVGISVPSFSGAVDEAKNAADQANVRAAKVAAIIYDMDTNISDTSGVWYHADTRTGSGWLLCLRWHHQRDAVRE